MAKKKKPQTDSEYLASIKFNKTPKKKVVNKEFEVKSFVQSDDVKTEFICCACGKKHKVQKGNFIKTNSPLFVGNNGYYPVCKICLENYYYQLSTGFYTGDDSEEQAIDRMCQLLDWPYSDQAIQIASTCQGCIAINYPSKIGIVQIRREAGVTYLDTIKRRLSGGEAINSVDDVNESDDSDNDNNYNDDEEFVISKDVVRFWGTGFVKDDYEFLENQYEDWKATNECKTKAQRELFKALCIAQLNMRQSKGNAKAFLDATKVFQDLLGSANLKPTQNNDNVFADQNSFGMLIQKWETTDPIPEVDPELADVDGIKRNIFVWFVGTLCKVLHIKNPKIKEYEQEVKRYTVEKTKFSEEEDNVADILNNSDVKES